MPSIPMPYPTRLRGALPLLGMLVLGGWGHPVTAQAVVTPDARRDARPEVAACEARLARDLEPRVPTVSGIRTSPEQAGFRLVTGTVRTEPAGTDGGAFACLVRADGSRVLALVPPGDAGGAIISPGLVLTTPPTLSPARLQSCQEAVARRVEDRDGVRPIFSARPRSETSEEGHPQVVGEMTIPHRLRAPAALTYHCTLDAATGAVRDLRFSPEPGISRP